VSGKVFALVDGNSFYCSCERVFQPELSRRPVIVLSNNDGCAVARTPEAKALGIKMGAPFFQIRDLCKREGVAVFSSNYALYGDMSRRMNDIYHRFAPEVEVYSIDESFLDITGIAADRTAYGQEIRQTVRQWTGIPTCVGIGPTKTLAKLANRTAKNVPALKGVCDFTNADQREALLPPIPVGDLWGVGKATAEKLKANGIETVGQLRAMNPRHARQLLTVVGERMVLELNGVLCLDLEAAPPTRKGMAVTRGFSRPITTLDEMCEAIAAYATRIGEKLRQHGLAAVHGQVFMHSSPFAREPWIHRSRAFAPIEATNDTHELIRLATRAGREAWKDGYRYAKAGIILTELVAAADVQRGLWGAAERDHQQKLMTALDAVNRRYGRGSLVPAAAGLKRGWGTRFEMRSGRFSTSWGEMPIVSGHDGSDTQRPQPARRTP